jgi:serine/threonine protein kinase
LGSGQFGIVFKGEFKGRQVAIKTTNPNNSGDGSCLSLFEEIKVMCHLGVNDYIVGLVGAITVGINVGKVFALVEFCPMGSLLNYLIKMRSDFVNVMDCDCCNSLCDECLLKPREILTENACSSLNLISWSYQISKGMDYLGKKQANYLQLALLIAVLVG